MGTRSSAKKKMEIGMEIGRISLLSIPAATSSPFALLFSEGRKDGEEEVGFFSLAGIPKAVWRDDIAVLLFQTGSYGYVVVAEAWVTAHETPEQQAATMAALRHSPLGELDVPKKEVLMSSASGPDGSWVSTLEFKRVTKEDGTVEIVFGEMECHESTEGNLVNIGDVEGKGG
jgi:hypothetical protein